MDKLMAGVSRKIITPPVGVFLIGYGDRSKGNIGSHDDLTATALVLNHKEKFIALVYCDLLYINEYIIDRIRSEVGKNIEVVVSCSHTHSGPITYADSHSPGKNKKYINYLIKQITLAIHEAYEHLKPVQLYWSATESDIAINRREIRPDGSVVIGRNPNGPVDRSVQILSVCSNDNQRIATLVNCSCHATVLGPDNLLATADWVGEMRAGIESELGGLTLFLQGAAGNLNPEMAWGKEDCWEQIHIQGMRVANVIIAACKNKMEPIQELPLFLVRKEEWLPLNIAASTPEPPKTYQKHLATMLHLPGFLSFIIDIILNKRFPWRPRVESHNGMWSVPLRINILNIGDFEMVSFSAEVFTETGMKVKALTPSKYSMFVSVTDGSIAYLPTEAALAEGGFEVIDSPFFSKYPGQFTPECERLSINAVKVLRESVK